jgi:hypothetical protein
MVTTHEEFIERLKELYANNVEISKRKNKDYCAIENPFANFLVCESVGIPAEVGLIVRISDKVSRISNLVRPGVMTMVKDESVLDTLSDLANYAMILRMYLETKTVKNEITNTSNKRVTG